MMRHDADISKCAGDVKADPQWNVRPVYHVLIRQTKVDHVDRLVLSQFPPADDKVLRFDVAKDQVSRMNVLQSTQLFQTFAWILIVRHQDRAVSKPHTFLEKRHSLL